MHEKVRLLTQSDPVYSLKSSSRSRNAAAASPSSSLLHRRRCFLLHLCPCLLLPRLRRRLLLQLRRRLLLHLHLRPSIPSLLSFIFFELRALQLASPSSTPIGVASSPIAVERLLSQRRLLLSPSLSRRRLIVSSSPLPALSPIVSVSSPIHSSLEASDCGHLLFLGSSISLLHSPCKATTILGFQQHCYSTQRRQLIIPNFLRSA